MHITKLDAARRQLETAIGLYFHEGDPISVHTLAAAAHGVLADVSRSMKPAGPEMLYDWVQTGIKAEYVNEVRRLLRAAQNFFKHADNDASAVLHDFKPEMTEILLWDSCRAYRSIAGERPPLLGVMESWARITFARDWLITDDGSDFLAEADRALPGGLTRWQEMTRHQFFSEIAPAAFTAHYTPASGNT